MKLQSKWSPAVVRSNIQKAQQIYKNNYDRKHAVREVSLTPGDWVRVKLGHFGKKGDCKFSKPVQIKELYSRSALLSDGKVWSHSRMVKCNKVLQWQANGAPSTAGSQGVNSDIDDNTSPSSARACGPNGGTGGNSVIPEQENNDATAQHTPP